MMDFFSRFELEEWKYPEFVQSFYMGKVFSYLLLYSHNIPAQKVEQMCFAPICR